MPYSCLYCEGLWARLATCKENNGHMFLFERKRLNMDQTPLVGRARVVWDSTAKLVGGTGN